MSKLDKVNNFLSNLNQNNDVSAESNIILSGPDTIKNILINETLKLGKLETVSNELLSYLTNSRTMKNLSYKEKKSLLETITTIQNNSRDFIFKVAEMSNKNAFLKDVLKLAEGPKETILTASNGETYISSVDDETRRELSELLREVINDRITNG